MANDLELALKIRADLGATRQTIAGLSAEVNKLGKSSAAASAQMKAGLSGLQGIAANLKASFVGIGAGLAFREIIKATTDQEAAMAQIEARIKSTGGAAGVTSGQLSDLASELQNTTTFADDQINAMQATLLAFTNVTGQTFIRANSAILDLATALGQDLQTAALQVGKALNDPIEGATKLQRAGVKLTDSQVQLIKQLVETGRLAQAQDIILKQLETQFGGAAKAARDTFGGALMGLKNAFSDLLEAHQGLPGARDEIEKLSKLLADPQFQASADKITSALVAGFAELLSILPGVLSQMKELAPLIGAIGGAIAGGRTGTLVGSIFGPQIAAGAGIVGAVIGGVKGYDAGSAIKNFEPPPPPVVDPAKAQADAAAQAQREKDALAAASERAKADALAAAARARADAARNEAQREAKQQAEAIRAVIDNLQKEADTYGMSSEEIAIYNLQKLGANDATIAQALGLTETIQKQQDEAAATKATEEAIKAEAKARDDARKSDDEYILSLGEEIKNLSLTGREIAQNEAVRRLSSEATAEQIAAVRALSGALYDQQQVAKETTDQMSEFAVQAARNMQTAFADFLFDPFKGGLQGMLEGFITVLRQMTSQALAARIFETIGAEDLFKNVLSFGGNSGADAAAQQAAATAAAAALTTGGATAGTAITTGAVTGATALTASGTATAASIVAGAQTAAAILAAASAPSAAGGAASGISGILSGLFHSGGIVGSGGATRMMPSIAFANAPRYHSGGIAGLAADELPAVLRRNEEVLTRNDPRHRYNGGGQQAVTLKNINLFDTQVIGDYLATGEGEKVVLNIVSRNRNMLR